MIVMPVHEPVGPPEAIAATEGPLDQRRRALTRLLQDLGAEIESRLRVVRSFPEESKPVMDAPEAAVEDLTRDLEVRLVEQGFAELRRIDEALTRLNKGTYGVCRRCHSAITEERLHAVPFAVLCQRCQRREEQKSPPPLARL
jgi:DnaK suppressor protein